MADTKWSDYATTDTTPTSDDQVIVLNDPGGTPGSRKVTLANLGKGIFPGITDSTTGARLQLTNTILNFGEASLVAYTLANKNEAGVIALSGGSSGNAGGSIWLYGNTHATLAKDVLLKSEGNTFFAWDESAGTGAINTTTSDASDTGSWTISGGGTEGGSRGGSVRVYGNEHANTGDVQIFSGDVAGSNILLSAFGATSSILMLTNNTTALTIDNSQQLGIGKSPNSKLDIDLATEDLEIVDAGSAAATEQDWIEVEVGGVQGYIRVYAAK